MVCTSDVFSNVVGAHDLPAEPLREGGNEDREGEVGESTIVDPQSAQETCV